MALVFDIETIGEDYDSLDKFTKEHLLRWIRRESLSEEEYAKSVEGVKSGLGFSPLTGRVITIGSYDSEQKRGAVYFLDPQGKTKELTENNLKLKPFKEEHDLLDAFWQVASHFNEFVSYAGRTFDAPFLMIRSAINGLKPTKDLMSYRYLSGQRYGAKHYDLQDLLTFQGAVRRKGTLHLWARAFGIKSPKEGEVTGDKVATYFKAGRFLEIAHYNAGDLKATAQLYEYWKNYLKF